MKESPTIEIPHEPILYGYDEVQECTPEFYDKLREIVSAKALLNLEEPK